MVNEVIDQIIHFADESEEAEVTRSIIGAKAMISAEKYTSRILTFEMAFLAWTNWFGKCVGSTLDEWAAHLSELIEQLLWNRNPRTESREVMR